MITITQVLAGLVAIGVLGSSIEKVGIALQNNRIIAIGKLLEGIAQDCPKIIKNVYNAVTGKPSD